jgi:hypothetical protein
MAGLGPNTPSQSDLEYQYFLDLPPGGVGVQNASGNVAATATTATLPGVAGKTTYITGFDITGAGATAGSAILITVTGVAGGTLTYVLDVPTGATAAMAPYQVRFPYPLPASAVNTPIVVNVPSFGAGNTNAAVVAYGFQI